MLSFERKKSIFQSYQDVIEKPISNNRINYAYTKSLQGGKTLATQLHPSGNGYVLGKYLSAELIKQKGYTVDSRGWIAIKNFSEEDLREVIILAMKSMSNFSPNAEQKLTENEDILVSDPVEQDIQSKDTFEELVRSCLYNWLGYGNLNSPIWFLGIEEGGAEVWRRKTKTLDQSLSIRSKFVHQMDFRYVWEDLYNIPLETFRGPNVWRYMVAFLLEFEKGSFTTEEISDFIFREKKLGSSNSNHFLGELMPLPKKSKDDIEDYNSIWPTINEYYRDVAEKRFSLINRSIVENPNVRLIVSYDKTLTEKFLNFYSLEVMGNISWQFTNEQYNLSKIAIAQDRTLYFLSTPFFGNGRISYLGIKDAARKIKNIL